MIVVTGATGFIGRRVVSQLIKKNKPADILCLVWRKNNSREQAGRRWLRKTGVGLREVELLDKKSLQGLPQNPRLVFHLAATTDTSLPDYSCNDIGTNNLIAALQPNNRTHFIYTGTCAMHCGRLDCHKPINEPSRPMPSNRYGWSKLRAEELLKRHAQARGFSLSILRPPTVYGSNPRDDSLFEVMKKLITKRSLLARLNWPGLTSLVWVDDTARVITWVAKHPSKLGKFNEYIVSAESLTLAEISRLIHLKLGIEYNQIALPRWFWRWCATARKPICLCEKLMPSGLYNFIWRATLVVDNVLYCNAEKITKLYPAWKPALFKNKVNEVI